MVETNELEVDVVLLGGFDDVIPSVKHFFAEKVVLWFGELVRPPRIVVIPMASPDPGPVHAGFLHFGEIGGDGLILRSPSGIDTDRPEGTVCPVEKPLAFGMNDVLLWL